MENMKKLKDIDIHKAAMRKTRVLKLVFITRPCLKIWALCIREQ